MRAAVYSAGPSIATAWRGGYDIGICVNGASLIVPPEHWQWLCCGDWQSFLDDSAYPAPSVGCFAFNLPLPRPAERFLDKRWLQSSDVHWLRGGAQPTYTISASLALAHTLGATSIDLYGHDELPGATNCEAKADPAFIYTEYRTSREAMELQQVRAYLTRHHVTVTRK